MLGMHLKKIVLLFLFVSAFLLSTPLAGRPSKFMNMQTEEVDAAFEIQQEEGGEATANFHERLLRGDYGRYDPSPALVKPPFKLIPN